MTRHTEALLFFLGVVSPWATPARAGDAEDLQGLWTARFAEVNGMGKDAAEVKQVRFTFEGERLRFEGLGKTAEFDFTLDSKELPKHLNLVRRSDQKKISAIYDIYEGRLKVCLHPANDSEERRTRFATKPDSGLLNLEFQHQPSVAGRWTGPWSNSLNEEGESDLQLTEGAGGSLQGKWDGIKVTGKRNADGSMELTGSSGQRDYQITCELQGVALNMKYTATNRDSGESYKGSAYLKRDSVVR